MSEAQDILVIDIKRAVENTLGNHYQVEPLNQNLWIHQQQVFDPIEIDYNYGQLYSPDIGWKIEASQEIHPFGQKRAKNLNTAAYNCNKENFLLSKRRLESEVKHAYNTWLFYINLLALINDKKEFAQEANHAAKVKQDLGESEPVDEALATLETSKIETEYLECLINIDIAENKLKGLMGTEKKIKPLSINFEMYQIDKRDDTSRYNGKHITDVLLAEYKLEEARTNTLKNKKHPSIKAGIFYQDVADYNKMIGFHAGIKLPLGQKSTQEVVERAKIRTERKLHAYKIAKSIADSEITNLILELDKKFIRIRHFQNYALPTADLLLNTSLTKFEKEEISYDELIEKANKSIEINEAYLSLIYEYNNLAFQLEIYTKSLVTD